MFAHCNNNLAIENTLFIWYNNLECENAAKIHAVRCSVKEFVMVEVVAALIWRGDRFLICQRPKNKSRALLWEFVGGKVESGESREDALKRECREELDVDITVGKLFVRVEHEYPDVTIGLSLFEAKLDDGQEIKLLEHSDAKWITADEIDKYEFCPADKGILAKIKTKYRASDI